MASGIPYKQAKLAEAWDAIVIGSGIGGLTAAVLLGVHAGKRVLVLERHYEAGGFTHTFHRPGYEWDVGLHYIGQMQDERATLGAHSTTSRQAGCNGSPCRMYTTASSSKAGHSTMPLGWNASGKASGNRSPANSGPSTGISQPFGPATARAAFTMRKRRFRRLWRRWLAA